MKKTSLKEKISLIIFGVLLALVLLEAGLRVAGGIVFYLQERHNHLSFNPNEYRILCLGESTTALGGEDSYPSQLEQMLNAQAGAKKFTVINEGIISTTSNYILAHLEGNLEKYKPQMVIVMMGINDRAYLHDLHKALWWEKIKLYLEDFRVYKLGYLLYEHITHRIRGINAPAQTADVPPVDDGNYQQVENFLKIVVTKSLERFSEHMAAHEKQSAQESLKQAGLACVELARRYRLQGSFEEAQKALEQATVFNPGHPDVYQEWGELYLAQGKSGQAVKAFQAALVLDPKNSDVLLGLAHAYYQEHNDNAFLVYAGYLQIKPQDYWGHMELAGWLKESKHYAQAQDYLDRAREISPDFDRLQKAAQQGMAEYSPATLVNYNLLLDKILRRHIKVVIMQYPLRDVGILKDHLGQRNGVIFVENKQNFKEALTKEGYSYYFKDNFAYDFGHCTRAGNELMARHLTEVILKYERS